MPCPSLFCGQRCSPHMLALPVVLFQRRPCPSCYGSFPPPCSYDNNTWVGEAGGVALGHVTNYAQNMDGTVWDMLQLRQHMGPEAFEELWGRIQVGGEHWGFSSLIKIQILY